MANQEHVERLQQGPGIWNRWRQENLEIKPDFLSADLSSTDLRNANLKDANLSGANLSNANLSGSNFSSAFLNLTNLGGSDLRRSYLSSTKLYGANLSSADLSESNLSSADLSNANLSNANLIGTDLRRSNLRGSDLSSADLSNADLSNADLSNAILNSATLHGTNLSNANLSNADLRDTNLSSVNLSSANLAAANLAAANLIAANLSSANLSNADLYSADLHGAKLIHTNLSNANLRDANLRLTDLRDADLSGANLTAMQALGAYLKSAILTGACIEDWNINFRTNLQEVICDYIFIKYDPRKRQFTDRRPHNPSQFFAPGEFTKRYQIVLETVELFFNDGIDWKAFLASLQELQIQYGDAVNIQGIERKAGGAFLVRLEVPPETDRGALEQQAKEFYENSLRILEAKYHSELQAKDREIEIYKQKSADILELAKLAASRPITVEAKAVAEVNAENFTNNFEKSTIGNFANKAQDNARQQTNQRIYASSEKQSLAEAVQEIQKLLKILERTNPTASEADQKVFVTAATSPNVKQRAVSALQSGDEAALAEFLDNAHLNVAIAIIEGWRDAEAGS